MTPLLLFLLGSAVTYLGTVSAAFNTLMRLSLASTPNAPTGMTISLGWSWRSAALFCAGAHAQHHPDGACGGLAGTRHRSQFQRAFPS